MKKVILTKWYDESNTPNGAVAHIEKCMSDKNFSEMDLFMGKPYYVYFDPCTLVTGCRIFRIDIINGEVFIDKINVNDIFDAEDIHIRKKFAVAFNLIFAMLEEKKVREPKRKNTVKNLENKNYKVSNKIYIRDYVYNYDSDATRAYHRHIEQCEVRGHYRNLKNGKKCL